MLPRLRRDRAFRLGVIGLLPGTGPLPAIVVLSTLGLDDSDPSPIGPGLRAVLGFPSSGGRRRGG